MITKKDFNTTGKDPEFQMLWPAGKLLLEFLLNKSSGWFIKKVLRWLIKAGEDLADENK